MGLVGAGAVGALVFVQLVDVTLDTTDSTEFCISCHIMRDTVWEEYKETTHYKNPSGIRATCADCHIPHNLGDHIARKFGASRFLYSFLIGWVDTPEEFEAKREELAETVWSYMRASDSRECRNCHSLDAMDLSQQTTRAREQHSSSRDEGETCIDCHNDGIAHKPVKVKPAEGAEADDDFAF